MAKFRKRPTVKRAVQLSTAAWPEVCDLLGVALITARTRHIGSQEVSDTCDEEGPFIALDVTTTHGEVAVVRHGDWILPDSKPGTFYPVKPDVFAATYEAVD